MLSSNKIFLTVLIIASIFIGTLTPIFWQKIYAQTLTCTPLIYLNTFGTVSTPDGGRILFSDDPLELSSLSSNDNLYLNTSIDLPYPESETIDFPVGRTPIDVSAWNNLVNVPEFSILEYGYIQLYTPDILTDATPPYEYYDEDIFIETCIADEIESDYNNDVDYESPYLIVTSLLSIALWKILLTFLCLWVAVSFIKKQL